MSSKKELAFNTSQALRYTKTIICSIHMIEFPSIEFTDFLLRCNISISFIMSISDFLNMTRLNSRFLLRNNNSKLITGILMGLLVVSGVVTVTCGSNHLPFTVANAQLEESGRPGEQQMTSAEQLHESVQSADVPSTAAPNGGLSLKLDQAHFIPLSPLSNSPGNQVKMLLDYSVQDPTFLAEDTINAVMEVYSENQTLLRTSSLSEPIPVDDSGGEVQLATTFDDPSLHSVIVRALLTDGEKLMPLAAPIEEIIGLGEIRNGGSDEDLP